MSDSGGGEDLGQGTAATRGSSSLFEGRAGARFAREDAPRPVRPQTAEPTAESNGRASRPKAVVILSGARLAIVEEASWNDREVLGGDRKGSA